MTGGGSNRLGANGDGDLDRVGTRREPQVRIDPRTFFGTLPKDLLPRILDGDPLDLELRCDIRRDEVCFLILRERLVYKSAARVAHAGFSYRGEPNVEEWITARIDQSIEDILEEDEIQVRKDLPLIDESDYDMLSEVIGFAPKHSRAAHVAFNALGEEPRSAYFALSINGHSIEQYAAMGGGTPEIIQRNISEAVSTLLHFLPTKPEEGVN